MTDESIKKLLAELKSDPADLAAIKLKIALLEQNRKGYVEAISK